MLGPRVNQIRGQYKLSGSCVSALYLDATKLRMTNPRHRDWSGFSGVQGCRSEIKLVRRRRAQAKPGSMPYVDVNKLTLKRHVYRQCRVGPKLREHPWYHLMCVYERWSYWNDRLILHCISIAGPVASS